MPFDTVQPFSIHVPDEVLAYLRERIASTRWTDDTDAEPWRYGPPVSYMREFADH
jgi:microsomal epoxide hydrolase